MNSKAGRLTRGLRPQELEELVIFIAEELGQHRVPFGRMIAALTYFQPRSDTMKDMHNTPYAPSTHASQIPMPGCACASYHNTESRAQHIEKMRAELAEQEAKLEYDAQVTVFKDAINKAICLAGATVHLLSDIREISLGMSPMTIAREEYAEFRAELTAIAKPYGFKVAVVGDKKKACVARV